MSHQKPHRHEKMTVEEARIWARLTDAEYAAEIAAAARTQAPAKKQPYECTGDCQAGTCAYCGRPPPHDPYAAWPELAQRVKQSAAAAPTAGPRAAQTSQTEGSNFFVTNWKLTLALAFVAWLYLRSLGK
jgi:hypothetical protein